MQDPPAGVEYVSPDKGLKRPWPLARSHLPKLNFAPKPAPQDNIFNRDALAFDPNTHVPGLRVRSPEPCKRTVFMVELRQSGAFACHVLLASSVQSRDGPSWPQSARYCGNLRHKSGQKSVFPSRREWPLLYKRASRAQLSTRH